MFRGKQKSFIFKENTFSLSNNKTLDIFFENTFYQIMIIDHVFTDLACSLGKISLTFYLFKFFYILICVFHVHILFLLFPFKSSIFCIRCINFLFIFKIETFFSKKFLHHHLHLHLHCIVFLPFVSQFISLTTKYI